MKEQDLVKMEFLLTLNENIIVQRYFNVRDFNREAVRSYDVVEYVRDIQTLIEDYLRVKTATYMLDNKFQIIEDQTVMETSHTDGSEVFNIYLKLGEQTICHRVFDAKPYPPKVRYTVDLRPHLKDLLKGLTDIFSSKNLMKEYLDYSL
jgi:hypothetical protein